MIECQTDLFESGITSIQSDDFKYFPDGGAYDMMERIRKASDKGIFKLRMAEQALMYSLEEMETFFDQYGWDDSFGNRSFKIACIKLLADGSLGARTAYLRKPYGEERGEFLTATRIIELVGGAVRVTLSPKRIAIAMQRLGYEQRRVLNTRGWNVVILTGDQIKEQQRMDAHRSVEE